MDKRKLYDGLDNLEETLNTSIKTVSLMKKDIKKLIEKNNTLELENKRLRERLKSFEPKELEKLEKKSSGNKRSTLKMLEELYNDGFHVCHPFYGQRREHDAPCAWCSDFWAELTEGKKDE